MFSLTHDLQALPPPRNFGTAQPLEPLRGLRYRKSSGPRTSYLLLTLGTASRARKPCLLGELLPHRPVKLVGVWHVKILRGFCDRL
jgi:hypothetical protein